MVSTSLPKWISVLGVAVASSLTAAQPEAPQFHYWEKRPPGVPVDHQHDPIVRINITGEVNRNASNHAELVAAKLKDKIELWSSPSADDEERIDPARVVVLLQNIGGYEIADKDKVYSFLWSEDAINAPLNPLNPNLPDWGGSGPDGSNGEYGLLQQPWSTKGRSVVKDWMEDFLAAYNADPAIVNGQPVVPIAFHFDYERTLTNFSGNVAWTRLMAWCGHPTYSNAAGGTENNRYENTPVPGHNGKTLKVLWNEARAAYGWNGAPGQPYELFNALDDTEPTNSAFNKRFQLWWEWVCGKALVGILDECFYAPINPACMSHTAAHSGATNCGA